MTMAIPAKPPMTPPAMASPFGPPPPGSGGGDPEEDGSKDDAGVADPLGTSDSEGPMSEPGTASGVSIKMWSETVTSGKTLAGKIMLTAN